MRISIFEVKAMKKAAALLMAAMLAATAVLSGCAPKNGAATPDSAQATAAASHALSTAEPTAASGTTDAPTTAPAKNKPTQPATTPEQYDAVSQKLTADVDNAGFTGAAYAEWNGAPLVSRNADSVYRVASVSKQFTAAAVLLLDEQGKLSIDDNVQAYFPELRTAGEVTLHHLLCMRSGIPDCLTAAKSALLSGADPDAFVSAGNSAIENRRAIEQWIMDSTDAVPDLGYEYSNSNYFLLAEIIEKVSGIPYEDYIRQNLLSPLGMTSTGFGDTWGGEIVMTDGWGDNAWYGYSGVRYGAGDMVASARDLAVWAGEFIPGQNRVLSDSIVQKMTADYAGEGYGYGLMLSDRYSMVYHLGSLPPYCSILGVVPDKRFVLVMMDTRWNTALNEVYPQILSDFSAMT